MQNSSIIPDAARTWCAVLHFESGQSSAGCWAGRPPYEAARSSAAVLVPRWARAELPDGTRSGLALKGHRSRGVTRPGYGKDLYLPLHSRLADNEGSSGASMSLGLYPGLDVWLKLSLEMVESCRKLILLLGGGIAGPCFPLPVPPPAPPRKRVGAKSMSGVWRCALPGALDLRPPCWEPSSGASISLEL